MGVFVSRTISGMTSGLEPGVGVPPVGTEAEVGLVLGRGNLGFLLALPATGVGWCRLNLFAASFTDTTLAPDELEAEEETESFLDSPKMCEGFSAGGLSGLRISLACTSINSTKLSGKTPVRPLSSPFHQPGSSISFDRILIMSPSFMVSSSSF